MKRILIPALLLAASCATLHSADGPFCNQPKSPAAAVCMSALYPGLGDFYANSNAAGVKNFVAGSVGLALVVAGLIENNRNQQLSDPILLDGSVDSRSTRKRDGGTMIIIGAGISIASRVYASVTSAKAVNRWNVRANGSAVSLSYNF